MYNYLIEMYRENDMKYCYSYILEVGIVDIQYSKACLKQPLKKIKKIGFQDR